MQNIKIREMAITVAVEWWSNDLENPSFIDSNIIAPLLNNKIQKQNAEFELSKKQILSFRVALRSKLRELLEAEEKVVLSVNYEPDATLGTILKEISPNRKLSWKTEMEISNQEVKVSKGFASAYQTIYSSQKTYKK